MATLSHRAMAVALVGLAAVLLACGQQANGQTGNAGANSTESKPMEPTVADVEGLEITVDKSGRDHIVAAGDIAAMHYTGWLFDESAEDGKGRKFDSSRDRGQTFEFPLGEGRVIKGWDLGVAGMQIGEMRTLKIAPELGYGDRGAGGVIPPGATLLFEVELVSFKRCTVFE